MHEQQDPVQQLFTFATRIPQESLTINGYIEFYLFMDMWAEHSWVSYQMNFHKWVEAMAQYNQCLALKSDLEVVKKSPQALLQLLGHIKPRLIKHILRNEYTCESHLKLTSSHCDPCTDIQSSHQSIAKHNTDILAPPLPCHRTHQE